MSVGLLGLSLGLFGFLEGQSFGLLVLFRLHQQVVEPEQRSSEGSQDCNEVRGLHQTTHLGNVEKGNVNSSLASFLIFGLNFFVERVANIFNLSENGILRVGHLQGVALVGLLGDVELGQVYLYQLAEPVFAVVELIEV